MIESLRMRVDAYWHLFRRENGLSSLFKRNRSIPAVVLMLCVLLQITPALGSEGKESFSIIMLPDTQNYSNRYPDIFNSQTLWVRNNKESKNIVFVTHVGDIVDCGDGREIEWERAAHSMGILDGVVPYGVLPGNHDFFMPNYSSGAAPLYNKYFPHGKYENEPWYGGHYLGNKNNYQLFSAGGMDFVILHLEYEVPHDVLEWADKVLKEHPDRRAIISTHFYLLETGERGDSVQIRKDGNSPEDIWDKLVKVNGNVFMVLCGHMHGEALQISVNDSGRNVFEILADYQGCEEGGSGWLRILEFVPGENRIYVKTYSPYLDKYETDADSQFSLDYDMGGAVPVSKTETELNR